MASYHRSQTIEPTHSGTKIQVRGYSNCHKSDQTKRSMITLDIKSGFHHIPIAEQDREKLGISFKGRFYRWRVAPFGLAISPLAFCKTVRPVVQHLRAQGLRIVAYVDDLLLMAQPDQMNEHKATLLQTLRDLGWILNLEKCSLTPDTTKEYIGYKIVTKGQPLLKIPNARVRKLRRSLEGVLRKTYVTARLLARIAGQCIAMTKAIVPGKLLLRNLYRLLRLAKKTAWDDILQIDQATRQDLIWWQEAVHTWNGAPIVVGHVDVQIQTDASETGWGAVMGTQTAAGFWNNRMSCKPSNYREMMAILLALKSFKNLHGKSVQILTDNVSAAAYINHLGGPSRELTQLASAIWMEANNQSIVGSRIEVPCAIRVLEVLKVFSYRFEDAESNERGLTSGKCGELLLEGVFQNGGQNTLN